MSLSDTTESCQGACSHSSSDEENKNIGLQPYMHEPTTSKKNVSYENLSSSAESDDENVHVWIGNTNWCTCRQCKPIDSLC